MASSKDTFESGTFLANTFACGTFRGIGVDVTSIVTERFGIVGAQEDNFSVIGTDDQNYSVTGA